MSETPRTDAVVVLFREHESLSTMGDYVAADFARQLERELNGPRLSPPDRSEAVNLARNVVDKDQPLNLTSKGIRALADAVLQMDAWIREVTK